MKSMHHPLSLPGLTPKSGVPDFGAFKTTKVGNIRLWWQSILLRRRWTRGSSPRVTIGGRIKVTGTRSGACSDEVDAPFAVIAGLDPAIHPFAKMMDPRVKPAGDT